MNILRRKASEEGKEVFILKDGAIKGDKPVRLGFGPYIGGYSQSIYSSELLNVSEYQNKIDAAFYVQF